jgi:hypothetical protein
MVNGEIAAVRCECSGGRKPVAAVRDYKKAAAGDFS